MEMTLIFPDEMAQQLQKLSNPSEFVTQVVKEALNKQVLQPENPPLDSKSSNKWTRIVQRIANDPIHLAGYSKQIKKDMKEFRDNFEFSNDKSIGCSSFITTVFKINYLFYRMIIPI